ncbi:Nickel/cobalt transporter regulator [Kosakonia sp. BK9b]
MNKTLLLLALFACGAAHAATWQQVDSPNKPRTLMTGPDTFKNRLRYWFVMEDGNPSVYEVLQKNRSGEWVDVMHPTQNPVLVIKGNTLTLERRDGNKVMSAERFEKVVKSAER